MYRTKKMSNFEGCSQIIFKIIMLYEPTTIPPTVENHKKQQTMDTQ